MSSELFDKLLAAALPEKQYEKQVEKDDELIARALRLDDALRDVQDAFERLTYLQTIASPTYDVWLNRGAGQFVLSRILFPSDHEAAHKDAAKVAKERMHYVLKSIVRQACMDNPEYIKLLEECAKSTHFEGNEVMDRSKASEEAVRRHNEHVEHLIRLHDLQKKETE